MIGYQSFDDESSLYIAGLRWIGITERKETQDKASHHEGYIGREQSVERSSWQSGN